MGFREKYLCSSVARWYHLQMEVIGSPVVNWMMIVSSLIKRENWRLHGFFVIPFLCSLISRLSLSNVCFIHSFFPQVHSPVISIYLTFHTFFFEYLTWKLENISSNPLLILFMALICYLVHMIDWFEEGGDGIGVIEVIKAGGDLILPIC